jgi:hypothetical protein
VSPPVIPEPNPITIITPEPIPAYVIPEPTPLPTPLPEPTPIPQPTPVPEPNPVTPITPDIISVINETDPQEVLIDGYTNLTTSILGELHITFNGTLVITGPIVVTGFLSADGSLDITNGGLTIDGDLYLNSSSILRLAEGSILNITGCVVVNGSKVELTYIPTPNKPITVLSAPCINGSFSNVIYPNSNDDCSNYKWANSGTYITLLNLGCEPSNLFPIWGWIIIAVVVSLFVVGMIAFCYVRWDAILETKAFIKKLRELD